MTSLAYFRAHWTAIHSPAFLQKKLEDHRASTAIFLALYGLMVPALWTFDHVLDPIGAQRTIGLRLSFLLLIPMALILWHLRSKVGVALLLLGITLSAEVVYLAILGRLENSMHAGMSGMILIVFVVPVLCQGLSLRFNMLFTVVIASAPHLWANAGWIPGFPQALYTVLIWPSALLVLFVAWGFDWNYYRRTVSEDALERLAATDPLTGASNRRRFEEVLTTEMARCGRDGGMCALLILDIDHFKKINDEHGHPTGDVVIKSLATICAAQSRSADLVARLGGEEFAVLLAQTEVAGARSVAERIRASVEGSPFTSDSGQAIPWTVSIGVATWSAGGRRAPSVNGDMERQGLIERADAALYAAKRGGRNRVVVHEPGLLPAQPPSPA